MPQLAVYVVDLARRGGTAPLAARAEADVPADLTDDKGDTLVKPLGAA